MNVLDIAADKLRNPRAHPAIPSEHVAIDLECVNANPFPLALDHCNTRQVADAGNAEFWRRLAGSLRKAASMV